MQRSAICGYKGADVENAPPNRSLADDPAFLERLGQLDSGLDAGIDQSAKRFPPPRQTPPDPMPRPLLELFPTAPPLHGGAGPPSIAAMEPPRAERRHFLRSPAPALADTRPYETFYGLNEQPFDLSTDPKFLYHSVSHDRVAEELLGAIRAREGIVVLTGGIGTGKTTMCQAVIELLDRRTLTSFVLDRFVAVEDLLKTVLVDFGVISRDDLARGVLTKASGADLSVTLREFLQSLAALQAFAVVIIDEAQNLPIGVLQQICALADVADDQPLLQVVLVGQPNLLPLLQRPRLRPFNGRMVRCRLEPLAEDEIAEYIAHRLAVAGSSGRVKFSDRAVERVYKLSEGVPRIINLLCDRGLIAGHLASASVIDKEAIDEGAHELGLARSRGTVVGRAARAAMVGLALTVLMLVGAMAAASIFRAPLSRAIARWEQVPQPPPVAPLQLPAPLVALDPPAGADGAP
jgi:general secretion pathway protein A